MTIEAEDIEKLREQAARADHKATVYARALEKMRIALLNVHDGMEDEGDRIYFGSTNHADELRAAWHLADHLNWDAILEDTQPKTTLAAVNLNLQAEIERLRAENAGLREALTPFAEQKTVDEVMQGGEPPEWIGVSVERRIEMIGERKRQRTEEILRARAALATSPRRTKP